MKNIQGFTLVETLVAVAILMIAIAGPLTIANQALITALGSRNVMIATYLAQDGMESIKNIKDNNLATGNTWTSGWADISCTSGSPCSVPEKLNSTAHSSCLAVSACKLYTDDTESKYMYFYEGTPHLPERASPFSRFYYFSNPNSNGTMQETVVNVVVDWTDGSIPNEIKLQEIMTNALRN